MADEDDDDHVVDSKDHAGLVRRIEKLVRQNGELKTQLEQAKGKTTELEKAVAEAGKASKDAAKVLAERDALAAEKTGWAEERAILGAGVTDAEGIDFVRLAYSRIPEADRPKGGPAEWLQSRDKLPKGVQAYLPAAEASKGGAKPPPPPNTGAKPAPNGAGGLDGLAGMGNAEFAAARESIYAQLGLAAPPLPKPQG